MASRMSPERRKAREPASKPLMPRLAASAQAISSKATPPPRLAGYVSPPTNTPPVRKPFTTTSPNLNPLNQSASNTPVKDVADTNITPRSSARRTRANSAKLTPDASQDNTPTNGRPKSVASPPSGALQVTSSITKLVNGESKGPQQARTNGFPTTSPRTSPLHSRKNTTVESSRDGFMYANTVKSSSDLQKTVSPKVASQFFHADESRQASSQTAQTSKSPFVNIGNHSIQNGIVKSESAPVSQVGGNLESKSSINKPIRPAPKTSQTQPVVARPVSPPKSNFHLSYRKGASQVNLTNGAFPFSPSLVAQQSPERMSRHSRQQSSLDSDSDRLSQLTNGRSIEPTSPTSPRKVLAKAAQLNIEARPSPSLMKDSEEDASGLRSPGSAAPASATSDLAANARRERKVLDLEISNSSLLAINKSLEREVYKQKAELRRFRRMSRMSTRSISMLSDDPSIRSLSQLSELTEEDEEDEDPDLLGDRHGQLDDALNSESDEESTLSPAALEQSDARHRVADQRRLQLDLAKHKQLLIDSQQMNQSLKRCLLISEQLITDGNKALEYKAPVSDHHYGGRVLSPDEQEQYLEFGTYQGRSSDYFRTWEDDTEYLRNLPPLPDDEEEQVQVGLRDASSTFSSVDQMF